MTTPGDFFDLLPSTSTISDAISNALDSSIGTILNNTIGRLLYLIVSAISYLISLAYQLFEVFSGQIKITYKGEDTFLTNIFFEHSTIAGIYWGMAIIGVVLCFAFTIITVIRKIFDGSDKLQASLGAILGSMFKSILLILSLNVVITVVMTFTNVLMQQVVYVFNAGSSLTEAQRIDFTDDQFATMGRVLNTIGNYSLNPSYNSRYNLNSCFNEIRGDLLYLQQQGVFDFYYYTEDSKGNEVTTWQSALQTLVFASSLDEELRMDVYYEGVSNALLKIMDTLKTNTSFYPLEYFERSPLPIGNVPFDRIMFLACTYDAALNEQFNINPSHTDALRGPYYNGQKNIYNFVQVSEDFNLIWGFNYVVFFLIVYGLLKEMLYILGDCVARIYNMVTLYLVAPPFIALSPLDGGAKMKQWILAFVVQCFGIFGTVISMRLVLTFAPIVISTDLQIFSNPVMDITAKVIMIDAATLACKKTSGIITGILSDSSGWQSISAGNLRSDYEQRESKANASKGGGGGGIDAKTAMSAAKLASGAGDAQDVKNVADAAKEQKENQDNGSKDNKTDGDGAPKDNKPASGDAPKDTKTGGGSKDNKPAGGTTPTTTTTPSGGKTPSTTTTTPNSNKTPPPKTNTPAPPKTNTTTPPKANTTTPPKANTTAPPKTNTTSGLADGRFSSIPVAPDISQTDYYKGPNTQTTPPPQGTQDNPQTETPPTTTTPPQETVTTPPQATVVTPPPATVTTPPQATVVTPPPTHKQPPPPRPDQTANQTE